MFELLGVTPQALFGQLLLGLINPLAAAFALIETGPGENGTCPVIQRGFEARSSGSTPPS